jgi:hypothetical protein
MCYATALERFIFIFLSIERDDQIALLLCHEVDHIQSLMIWVDYLSDLLAACRDSTPILVGASCGH